MFLKCKISDIPFRLLLILFVIWSNTSYAPVGKNAGFYCDDDSIKRQYSGDSVRLSHLFGVVWVVIPLMLYLSEILLCKAEAQESKIAFQLLLKYYFSGFLTVFATTEVLKLLCSELRPHFFYTCMPDMNNIKCSDGLITSFNCTGSGPKWLVERDIYKSFPSGHASLSFYSFTFITIYLYSRARTKGIPISFIFMWWSRIIPLIALGWSSFCCVSRILDNRHFWWDVLTGVLIGFTGGIVTVSLLQKIVKIRR